MYKGTELTECRCTHYLGAEQQKLLHLYSALIRSKMNYGYVVYGSAQSSTAGSHSNPCTSVLPWGF